MKRFICTCLTTLLLSPLSVQAQTQVNITPKPYQQTKGQGSFTLPANFSVDITTLPDSNKVEAERFVQRWKSTTGGTVTLTTTGSAPIVMKYAPSTAGLEAYELDITATNVTITAGSNSGFFYAFKTLYQLLPNEVRAGVAMKEFTTATLPAVSIKDQPRFGYRGFMLDVSRHFFSVEEVKKFLDLMADYKMNRFHWHLTDDQGWRIEIKKYPKLTTVGATASNCYVTDMKYGAYWTNAQYGPLFYTQEEIKEVVAYAKERHIEIIPEIDMPGHFTAAMAAYPEYSCTPRAKHEVKVTGGIFYDILNVGNPQAVQFAKDILEEVMALFPYSQIHIGGDECPTDAWERNPECQKVYKEKNLTHYRQLQSHFIKDMADFIASKGKKTIVWNEAITAPHADLDLIKAANVTVFCWQPAVSSARKAAEMGLDNMITPWGPYYINRKQSTRPDEPSAAGDGTDNLAATYNFTPMPHDLSAEQQKRYTGVQGTFWTEHVADTAYLEYLALPRLFAIAEAGWTQQSKKNYAEFARRIAADTVVWKLKSLNFCTHDLKAPVAVKKVFPQTSTATDKYYYQLMTGAGGERKSRCIELLREGSPLLETYKAKGAQVNRLWTSPQASTTATNYEAQLWALEESPTHPGRYALVCKAQESGSLNPNPTENHVRGRWTYDATQKHYAFILGERGYSQTADNHYIYSLRSASVNNGFLNASLSGQGLAVNVYHNPTDGSAGVWTFLPTFQADALPQLLAEANMLVREAQTYEDEKEEGRFSSAAKENLQEVLATDPKTLSHAEYTALVQEALNNMYASFGALKENQEYVISNAVKGFENVLLTDTKADNYLRHLTSEHTTNAEIWIVAGVRSMNKLTQRVYLKNKKTNRYFNHASTRGEGYIGNPVHVGSFRGWVDITFHPATADYTIALNGHTLYPVASTSSVLPSVVSADMWLNNTLKPSVRPQGNAWHFTPNGTVSGISSVTTAHGNTSLGVYDLSGRRVQQPKKGLYIVDHHKVLLP